MTNQRLIPNSTNKTKEPAKKIRMAWHVHMSHMECIYFGLAFVQCMEPDTGRPGGQKPCKCSAWQELLRSVNSDSTSLFHSLGQHDFFSSSGKSEGEGQISSALFIVVSTHVAEAGWNCAIPAVEFCKQFLMCLKKTLPRIRFPHPGHRLVTSACFWFPGVPSPSAGAAIGSE